MIRYAPGATPPNRSIGLHKSMSKPLNVLWLIDHVCFDGSLHAGGRLYMNLLPRFDKQRIVVHPYFLNASDGVEKVFRDAGHPAINLQVNKKDPFAPVRIWNLARRHDVDVMHLFCFGAAMYGRMAALANGVPSVIHEFDTPTYGPYPKAFKVVDKLLAGKANFALAASTHCREFVHEQRYVPRDLIEVFYHAVPADKFKIAATLTRAQARAELGWKEQDFVFLSVTKLGPGRGNEAMIAAFAKVRKELPQARLVIVYRPTLYHKVPVKYAGISWIGDPKATRQRIEDLVAQHGVTGAVDLVEMEAPERHEPYFAASDVFVAPFEDESFSSVNLVEGMVFGLPQVVTDSGEPADIVNRWQTGIKVPAGQPDALAEGMLRLGRDHELRRTLGERARVASVDFGVQAVADRLSGLYERLARGDSVRAPASRVAV